MKNPITRNGALFTSGGFVAALFLAGSAHAITDTVFQYNRPIAGHFSFGPQAMGPGDQSTANSFFVNGPDYVTAEDGCFVTGVNLPDGAKLTRFDAWVATNSTNGAFVSFSRANVATGQHDFIS